MRNPSAFRAEGLPESPLDIYPRELYSLLKKQGYHWVGRHSAVKKCRWLHSSLIHNRACYKEKFYGVKSHRCLQMSPAVMSCLTHCTYCWRILPEDVGYTWDEAFHGSWDDPISIVDQLIYEQRRILSGYKSQVLSGKVDARKYQEALDPNQVAISLAGEPTLYPRLAELIRYFKEKGYTVYLVTTGVIPSALRAIIKEDAEPTHLYISITSPDRETYMKVNRPIKENLWNSVWETLEEVCNFSCTTVMRITMIRGVNMDQDAIHHFAKIIQRANFNYIEAKAYMHVGHSINRLNRQCMPSFAEVQSIAESLANLIGYNVASNDFNSRVVLLSKD